MPKMHDKRANRIPHTDKSITTMLKRKHVDCNDILATDDFNDMISDLHKVAPYATQAIMIYVDKRDGLRHYQISENTSEETAVYMLERVKLAILKGDDTEDED